MNKNDSMYMKDVSKKFFLYCVMLSFALCAAQISGSTILILAVLLVYLVLSAWAAVKDFAFPMLLYFLPWSPLVRMDTESVSFYTLSLIISCVFRPNFKINKKHIFVGISIAVLTMISKTIYGGSVSNSYLLFLVLLVVFPVIVEESGKKYNFDTLLLFFSAGIIIAALSAQHLMSYRNISKYIIDASYLQFRRLTGFYGDPNFYSAQIIAAISGLLVKIYYEKDKRKIYLQVSVTLVLLYCGLLSASKSFIILFVAAFVLWLYMTMKTRGKSNIKSTLVIAFVFALIFVVNSASFQTLIATVILRINYVDNISGFTTGRTDIWLSYLKEFASDAYLVLMGKGYFNVTVNGRAAHNIIIQLIYQLGLLGTCIMMFWFGTIIKSKVSMKSILPKSYILIMVILISLAPWLALDVLFFDEFFLMPLYVLEGIRFISLKQNSENNM